MTNARGATAMNSPAARARLTVARIVLGGLLMVFSFTALYVAAFHAPRAKGYDIGMVGSPAQAARLQSALDDASPNAFDVRRYDTEPRARAALLETDVHGVLVPGARADRILVANALGATPTQALTGAFTGVAAAAGKPVRVEDLRPLPSGDRRGLSSLFTVIGTLIPSLVFGALLSVLGRALPARLRWSAVAAFALLAGLIAAFNVEVLIGAFDSDFAGIAVVAGLLALAVSAAA